ncbi:hypothetical protein E5K00_01660 [Hymenobacter aquaticus]|uniref:Uncharacterized protein n=1 Tax=Hymenobacter aquaticus TaxID=1867101 RepID=A0A4Z0Q1T6_9BACT|nr:hypothetical protein [Hymenobacter aquaticus]TGE23947.1 hypothetical protein E5K00_01660 [Hymenobacter aquaticus]
MKRLLCLVLLLLPGPALYAKTPAALEQDLVRQAKRISYWADYADDAPGLNPADSLARANAGLRRLLLAYTAAEPATLTYAFARLRQEHVTIATSADGRLRIYSWDTRQGGTMRFFANVFQYRAGGGVVRSRALPRPATDAGQEYIDIFAVPRGTQTCYLAYSQAVYSSHDCYQQVKGFALESGRLNPDARLIRTGSGLRNTLGFAFDFFSVAGRPERPVRLIGYDPKTRVLTLPVVWADGRVTEKKIRYVFDGVVFGKAK